MKYIVQVTYHRTDTDVDMYITEGDYGSLGETSRMGDAAFYSTEEDAFSRAVRYANTIREEGIGIGATLKVLAVLTQTTDSIITISH